MPIQSNVNNTPAMQPTYYEDFVKQKENKAPSQDMDRDAFLKLLMTQLQNQDPMNPMEDTEFVSQMAQFSSLEQMTNLNETVRKMFDQQQKSDFVSHSDLIGKKVEFAHVVEEAADDQPAVTEVREGIVSSVIFKEGKAHLVIDNARVNTDKLLSVRDA